MCKDGTDVSSKCLGIMLKNNDTYVE